MKPLCPDCGDRHEKYQAHVWRAINKPAINKVAINSAINKETPVAEVKKPSGDPVVSASTGRANAGVVRTANRRTREAYNAYMRVKMAEYRARKKVTPV